MRALAHEIEDQGSRRRDPHRASESRAGVALPRGGFTALRLHRNGLSRIEARESRERHHQWQIDRLFEQSSGRGPFPQQTCEGQSLLGGN